MSVDEPTTATEDTSVSEVDNTSDPLDEDSWDDDTGFDQPDNEPDEPAEEAESTDEVEAEASEDVAEEEVEEETEQSEETETEAEAEEDTTSSEDTSTEKTQQQLNHEAFLRREAERKLREEREAREKQDLDRYLKDAEDDEAEYAKRQGEVERHLIAKERVALNREKLDISIQKFTAGNDLIKSGDKVVLEAFAEALDDFEAMYVVKDEHGNPLEIKADVYQYLQKKSDSIQKLTGIGARKQAKQKTNEKSRTVARPTRTPKEPAKDSDLDDFEKAFYGE